MTRKSAIRLLVGSLSGIMCSIAKAQTAISLGYPSIAEISMGELNRRTEAEMAADKKIYADCLKLGVSDRFCVDPSSALVTNNVVPGTATMTLNLDGWKHFEVKMGVKTVIITRQEIWEALQ